VLIHSALLIGLEKDGIGLGLLERSLIDSSSGETGDGAPLLLVGSGLISKGEMAFEVELELESDRRTVDLEAGRSDSVRLASLRGALIDLRSREGALEELIGFLLSLIGVISAELEPIVPKMPSSASIWSGLADILLWFKREDSVALGPS